MGGRRWDSDPVYLCGNGDMMVWQAQMEWNANIAIPYQRFFEIPVGKYYCIEGMSNSFETNVLGMR